MCGIFGAVSLAGAPLRHPGCLGAMAAALAHRGPDGERMVGHERARLGARRLAIMDLTTGDQPFESPDHTIWMICNGEIYNAPALRQEGKRAGYPFRSSGDIETIVPLYQRLGPDAVARLEGMFGLAVWDDRRCRLVLARDRAGEKPLFWTEVAGELRFASEVQALLVFPDQPRRVNPVAVALYAALGYVPAPLTMLAGISKLPPAHHLVADRSGITLHRYWDAAAAAAAPSGRGSAVATRPRAEPMGDPAILPTFLLAEAAREHVKVVLSGEGADELFGGYPTYVGHNVAGLYRRIPGRAALAGLVNWLPASPGKVTIEFLLKELVAAAELPPLERHLTWFGALGPDARTVAWASGLLDRFPGEPSLNRLLWLDFLSYLPDNLLAKVDRATMLASIEARAPYLDREVMELALPLASALKVRGFTSKAILKEAARGLVPGGGIRRRQGGPSVPVARWLNTGLAALAERHLTAPRLFPGAPTARLLAEHRSGKRNHARKLWPLLMAELWAERWNVDTAAVGVG